MNHANGLGADGPAGLTPSVLTTALRPELLGESGRVVGVRWERIGADRGFTGLVARLHVRYEPDGVGPATLVAKFPTAGPESGYREALRGDPRAARAFRDRVMREVRFYEGLPERSPVPAPRCWFTSADPVGDRVVLILEDVAEATAGDALAGCAPGEVGAVLAATAPVHAAWWGRRDQVFGLPLWAGDSAAWLRRQERYRDQWAALSAGGDRGLPASVRHAADRLGECLVDVLARLDAAPRVVVHADLHLDNVLFTSADPGRPVVVVDWQTVCLGPAAVDVARFVVTSLSVRDRRRHESALLRDYRDALRDRGVSSDLAALREECLLALLVYFTGVVDWLARGKTGDPHGREAALQAAALGDGRLVAALADHDVEGLLRRLGGARA